MAKTDKVKTNQSLRAVDAPFYRYWQALYLSFFCGRLYVDVGKRWKGLSIGYLLLLIGVASIPAGVRYVHNFNQYFQDQLIAPLKAIPKLYVQNGIVTLDKPMPYLIKDKTGKIVLIIDTTGKVKTINEAYPDLTMLITRDAFIYRAPTSAFLNNNGKQQTSSLADSIYTKPFDKEMNQIFDGEQWLQSSGIERVKWVWDLLIFPVTAFVLFSMALVFFLTCTFMAQIVAQLFIKISITYKQAFRLFVVSATPTMVLMLAMLALDYTPPLFGLLLITLLAIYFYFGVSQFKAESNKLVHS